MADMISRAAAVRIIADMHGLCRDDVLRESIQAIKELPTVDAAPVKHGRWEPSNDYNGYCCCSACHNTYIDPDWLIDGKWQYCPACGARMGGETDG